MLLRRRAPGARCAVDHFLPWSRHPDNTTDNLVAAHPRCNNAKSASLASLDHLQHWLTRFQPGTPASTTVARSGGDRVANRSDRGLSAARATCLWLPERTRLWQQRTTYEPLDTTRMHALFASVT